MENIIRLALITAFSFFIFSCSGGGGGGTNSSSNTNGITNSYANLSGNTFIALYMVGSDLESDGGAGSTDLMEIVKGYESLSASQKSEVFIYVAFGGANKDGWRGVKYANIKCLIQDSKDKKFGNDTCYDYAQQITTQNLKNMSHPQAFGHFIKQVKTISANFNTKILVMWNHGAAYEGYGVDENWQSDGTTLDKQKGNLSNNDRLTIYEIRDVLQKEGAHFDIIGFDACLMANLEVASAIKDFGTYLVASEETEPNHGWDYTDIIKKLTANINKSALDKAKLFVDSYVDNPNHEKGSGLTLSVIDLTKIDNLKTALDNINFNNLNLSQIVSAEKTSQKYGYSMDGQTLEEDYYTIDMVQFFDKAKLTSVRDRAKSVVLYTKNDGSIISNGISMASFSKIIDMISNNNTTLKTKNILPQNYFAGLENIQKSISTDKTKPNINNPYACTNNGKNGICLTITDNTAVESVGIYTLLPTNAGAYLVGYDYLPKISQNTYFLDKNEYMSVVAFCEGTCSPAANKMFAPIYFLHQTPLNELVYISPVVAQVPTDKGVIDLDGYLIMKIDVANQKFDIYFSISPTSKTRLLLGKHITSLKFKYLIVDSQGNISQQVSQALDFSNGFDIASYSLQGSTLTPVMVVEAVDVMDNAQYYNVP